MWTEIKMLVAGAGGRSCDKRQDEGKAGGSLQRTLGLRSVLARGTVTKRLWLLIIRAGLVKLSDRTSFYPHIHFIHFSLYITHTHLIYIYRYSIS